MNYSRRQLSKALLVGLLLACVVGTFAPAVSAQTDASSVGTTAPTSPATGNAKGPAPDKETSNQRTSVYYLITIFSNFIEQAVSLPIFTSDFDGNPNQYIGKVIRDGNLFLLNLANIGFIFALLFIAIATILGLESYSLQRALPRLVIAILLANFGLFFVKLVVDVSQLINLGLLGQNLANQLIAMTSVTETISSSSSAYPSIAGGAAGQAVGGTLGYVLGTLLGYTAGKVYGAVTSISDWIGFIFSPPFWFLLSYFFAAILLIWRLVGLWFLAIAAPIGVAAAALPSTEKYAKLYWKKVLQYAFIGPVMLFFLRIALIVWNSFNGGKSVFSAAGAGAFASGNAGALVFTELFRDAAVIAIVFLGMFVSLKMGVEMANFSAAAAGKGLQWLWKTGKAVAFTAATLATGGGAAAAGAAARLGVSETTGKWAGKAAGTLGKNLKAQFGGKGVMGKFGGLLAGQAKGLEEYGGPPEKKLSVINELAGRGDNARVQSDAAAIDKNDPAYIDDLKNDPAAALARANSVGAGLPADEAERQKTAYALRAAKAGVIDRDNVPQWTSGLSPAHMAFVDRQAALQGDAAIGIRNYDSMNHDEQVAAVGDAFKKGVPPEMQNVRAMQDPAVAQAAFEAKRATWEKFNGSLSPEQREAMAGKRFRDPTTGVEKEDGLMGAAALQTDNARKREYLLRSAEVGGSPEHIERSGAYGQLQAAGQNVRATINNVINNDAKYYVNQSGASAVRMMSNVTDPRKAVAIMNNDKLPDAVRGALVGELRNAASPIQQNMRRLLLGNMETANQRNALAMQGILKRIESQAKKATQAAEAAGEKAPT